MTALHRRIETAFNKNRDKSAVLDAKGQSTNYRDLANIAGGLQHTLIDRSVSVIGILSTRRLEAYAAVIAVFFSNLRFVPLNADLPKERLQKITAAAKVELVLCDESTLKIAELIDLPFLNMSEAISLGKCSELRFNDPTDPSRIAYQMFTSGSTGEPKGVPISHASLSHYATAISKTLDLPQNARFSQLFDLSFDLSLHDIFVGLSNAGVLCPASNIDLMMPHAYLANRQIDIWFSVPMLAGLAVKGQADRAVKHNIKMALFCGEALPSDHAAAFSRFLEPGASLYNLYGPTEATIAFTAKLFEPADKSYSTVPLGKPFGDNLIAIETSSGEVVEAKENAEGELLLAGPQVFDGYQPETGASVFVEHSGRRYYRSGDIVRVIESALLHVGRKDNQIKLRGYRIELGDVEAAVRQAFGYTNVAAVLLGAGETRDIGVAYESARSIEDVARINDFLPAYMRPKHWLRIDKMPTNINNKIDRKTIERMSWSD